MNTFNLTLFQWNCRSIEKNKDQFIQHLVDRKYDIISLQSLNVQKERLPRLSGYYYPPVYNSCVRTGKVYTALYVHKNYRYTEYNDLIPKTETGIYSSSVKIRFNNIFYIISSVYLPTGPDNTNTDWVRKACNTKHYRYIITGDFNAHSPFWDHNCQYVTSNHFLENIIDSKLFLLNTGEITRIPDNPLHKPSALDLTLISPELATNSRWTTWFDPLGSDHLPIVTTLHPLKIFQRISQDDKVPKFAYKHANWDLFSSQLSSFNVSDIDVETLSVDNLYSTFSNTILSAAKNSIPLIKTSKHSKHHGNPWWNEECNLARKEKWLAFKKYLKTPNHSNLLESKKAKNHANRVISRCKKDYWTSLYSNCTNTQVSSQQLWSKLKEMDHGFQPPKYPIKLSDNDLPSDQDISEAFVDMFSEHSTLSNDSAFDPTLRIEEDQCNNQNNVSINDINYTYINSEISMDELTETIGTTVPDESSVGLDGISKEMILYLPSSIILFLLVLLNKCWMTGIIPSKWKSSIIVPIHKFGLPPSVINSYRPISLTSNISKLFESILLKRLTHFCDKFKIIPVNQAGFQKGRSCTEHIVKLTTRVKQQFARRKNVLATFFDISKAYDKVIHSKLINKLQKLHVSGNMLHFIKEFIRDRTIQVRIGSSYSSIRTLDIGLPQGAVLSPVLFNIFLADLPSLISDGTFLVQYADDMCMWRNITINNKTRKRSLKFIQDSYQADINIIQQYMTDNGFKLSTDKTKLMFFSPGPTPLNLPTFTLYNKVLNYTHSIKFLGAFISSNLKWNYHIDHLLNKGRKALNLLKVVVSQKWGQELTSLRTLAYGLVRSKLIYAQEAYFSAPAFLLNKIDSIDCRAFKIALGVPLHSNNLSTYKELDVLPLDFVRKSSAAKFLINSKSHSNFCVAEAYLNSNKDFNKRARTINYMRSIRSFVSDVFEKIPTHGEEVASRMTVPLIPPWQLKSAKFDLDNPDLNKSVPSYKLKALVMEYFTTNYTLHTAIYTDGSALDNNTTGAAFYIPSWDVHKQVFVGNSYSIFTAELIAIFSALKYISNLRLNNYKFVFCVDSKSAILAIKNKFTKIRSDLTTAIRELIHNILNNNNFISFFWVPSHCGINANEMVDRYAKMAARKSVQTDTVQIPLDQHEYHQLIDKYIHQSFDDMLVSKRNNYSKYCLMTSSTGRFWNNSRKRKPRHIYSLMAKLRLNALKTKYCKDITCDCGLNLSVEHLLLHCPIIKKLIEDSILHSLFEEVTPSLSYLLTTYEILQQMVDILYNSKIRKLL